MSSSLSLLPTHVGGYSRLESDSVPPSDGVCPDGCWVRFRRLCLLTVSLPLSGFLFCVLWSVYFHFDESTSTHCAVYNFLPSISAATGSYAVPRFVWRAAILVHTPSRFLSGCLMRRYWQRQLLHTQLLSSLLPITHVLYTAEILGLLGLSMVTSSQNFPFHKSCFIVFLVCSELHMLISCKLAGMFRKIPASRLEQRSRRQKKVFFVINLCSLALCMYSYARHNAYCEDLMYTVFAFSEYVVVVTNMLFHTTAYWDLYDVIISLPSLTASNL